MIFRHAPRSVKVFGSLSLGIALIAGIWVWWQAKPAAAPTDDEFHIHAAFQVYINDQLQDYSGLEFQHIKPCSEHEETQLSAEEEQEEKAHLHEGVGDVVHVHRENATWGDLMTNLKVILPEPVTGSINGQAVDDILHQPITVYDRVVIFAGQNSDIETKRNGVPTVEYIKQTEQAVESC